MSKASDSDSHAHIESAAGLVATSSALAVDRSGRRALIASWLGWMFDGYENYAFVLVLPLVVREFLPQDDLPYVSAYIGGLLAVNLLGWATGGVVAGVLADYIGRKRMLMVSILWYALFAGLTVLSTSYWMLAAFRFLTGLGLGAEWGPGAAIVAESWPPESRGRAAGALQAAFGVGFFLASGTWLYVSLLGPWAWRLMFVLGVLPAVLVLYIRRGVHDSPLFVAAQARRLEAQRRITAAREVAPGDRELTQFTITRLFANAELRRRLIILLFMSLSTVVGWWSISSWIPEFVARRAAAEGLNAQRWAGLAGLTYNIGAIAGYIAFGILADMWGRKPTICLYYLGALVLSLVLFLAVQSPAALLLVAAVNGVFTLGQFSWMAIYLAELFPTSVRGSAISLVFDSSRYVAAFGPLVAGTVIARIGDIGTPAAVMSLIYLLGLFLTPWAGPETRGKPLPA